MFFFFSSRRRHTRYWRDWSSDVCSSDLNISPLIGSPSGTLGCLVTDGKFIYLLSNCHVLATNGDSLLDCPILQPGRKYGGNDPEDKIAKLSKYIEPKYITPTSSPENRSEERRVGNE